MPAAHAAPLVGTQLGQTLLIEWRSPLVVFTTLASVGVLFVLVETRGASQLFGNQLEEQGDQERDVRRGPMRKMIPPIGKYEDYMSMPPLTPHTWPVM